MVERKNRHQKFLRRGVDHLDRHIHAGREPVRLELQIVELPREIAADGDVTMCVSVP